MVNAGRSTDRAMPTSAASSSNSSSETLNAFKCRAPECDRSFGTSIGRSVHEVKAHPDWSDEQKLTNSKNVKERWNDEERKMLARKEAELSLSGERLMNKALIRYFKNRTLESIKSQRKRTDHKEMVLRYQAELTNRPAGDEEPTSSSSSADEEIPEHRDIPEQRETIIGTNELKSHLENLTPLSGNEILIRKLNNICQLVARSSKDEILVEVSLYLKDLFPTEVPENRPRKSGISEEQTAKCSKKVQRRKEYARTQDLWRKDRGQCVKRILSDQMEQQAGLTKELMAPYWKAVMTREIDRAPILRSPSEILDDLWSPITEFEVRNAYPPMNTAAGPDGITTKMLKKVPNEIMRRVMCLLMYCGKLPVYLNSSRTVLIPKKKGAKDPGEYRPITVSSVLVRFFHKILANRFKKISLDQRQRAFREADGCSENIMLLDLAFQYHHKKKKKMFSAVLDMAKAFDSVTFNTLIGVLKEKGVPDPMIDYIMTMYRDSNTILQHGGWESEKIHPTCGVKQGDPLSPILFNMVIDVMLERVTSEIGVDIGGTRHNVLAFADDLVLLASTEQGLQSLLDQVTEFLYTCGLEANPGKCKTIAIRTIPKQKKIAIDQNCKFNIRGVQIPSLKRTDKWTYLGIPFNAEGRLQVDVKDKFSEQLGKLTKAPLKPQQRLWALNNIVIPGLLYQLALGGVTFGYLRAIDNMSRLTVRKWLSLPKDCPNGYFHASVEDGGLGIPSIRWQAPLERLNRLKGLETSQYIEGDESKIYLEAEMSKTELRLKTNNNQVLSTKRSIREFWAEALYARYDGAALRQSCSVRQQHKWVSDGTRFLSGRDYINSIKLRINAMPTRSRTARGQARDRHCRGGCCLVESLNHVVQHCHRTQGSRIKRHDAIVKSLVKNLRKSGYEVEMEPEIKTTVGNFKPDIVATLGKTTLVVDAQVMSEQSDLELANGDKIRKYGTNIELQEKIRARTNSVEVKTYACTLSMRGIWSKTSCNTLLAAGIIRRRDIKIFSSRVILGGIAAWNQFNHTTTVRHWRVRRGVG